MPRPTGPQFVTLYRGLEGVSPDMLDKGQMGMHWTPKYDVARSYANAENSYSNEDFDEHGGVVVEAKVHKRHIIEPGSEEWEKVAGRSGVFDRDESGWGSWEQEHSIRPGAPVHVTQLRHLHPEGGSTDISRKDMSLSELRKYRA